MGFAVRILTRYRRCVRLWIAIVCMCFVGYTISYIRFNIYGGSLKEVQSHLDIGARLQPYHHRTFHAWTVDSARYIRLKSIFYAGKWKSDLMSSYHKPYSVNCSAILSGDKLAIDDATMMVKDPREIQLPSASEIAGWVSDCDGYRERRKYPTKSRSDEEENYPIAYILAVQKLGAQVERLFRAIYAPQNVYCFHVDTKAPREFHKAIQNLTNCFSNAFIASTLENLKYTRIKADLNCMSDLMSHKWKYVINLGGLDFPLKTNREIVWQLKALKGKNDIPGIYPEQSKLFEQRTRNHHEVVDKKWRMTSERKPPPPNSALMYFGSAYFAAKREFVEYVLTNQTAIDLLKYLSDSSSPAEHYWVTVNKYPGAPGGFPHSTWASSIRFINWTNSAPCVGKWEDKVCTIGTGYLPYVSTMSQLFVSEIHYGYDPVPLQCMEELLDYRTNNPESIFDFVPEYPVTNLFDGSPDRKPNHL